MNPLSPKSAAAVGLVLLAALALAPVAHAGPDGRAFTVVDDAAYVPPAEPEPAPPPVPIWKAEAGSTLRSTLTAWAARAGWAEPRWDAGIDYPIAAPMTFEGRFQDAVVEIFAAHSAVPRPLLVDMYVRQHFIHVTE